MDRRTFLQATGASALPLSDLERAVNAVVGAGSEVSTNAGTTVFGPEIAELRYPLAFVPSIREPRETLRVELATDVSNPTTFLRPQIGTARPRIELEARESYTEISDIWRGETVQVVEYEVPQLTGDVVETSYDLIVEHDDGVDGQRGAVSLQRQFPDDPTVVVFSDSHIAEGGFDDPEHAANSTENFATFTTEQVLEREPSSRWEEVQRLIAEINLLEPDLILCAGDLFSVQDYPKKYYMEYKDGHRIYSRLTAPTYTTLGNHDGYNQSTVDGIELYTQFIAPEYYSLDIRPGLHLVSANTYDWSALDRTGVSWGVSAWGGQIREDQLAWLRNDLTDWRQANPDGNVVVLGHHNPTALQDDPGEAAEATDGLPGAEQVARGADSQFVQGGQVWYGKNRLAWRDLLADADVELYLTGHVHRDRLARYIDGDVVRTETPGPSDFETGQLHYVTRDGESDDSFTQSVLRDLLTDPSNGPLFVESTCASSATGQYDGYRLLSLDLDGGVDPSTWESYPATQDFLDDSTADAGFTAEHTDLGLYSTPSFQLESELLEATEGHLKLEVTNNLVTDIPGASVFSLGDSNGVRIKGGKRVWRRRHGGTQDIKVSYEVPAETTITITVECRVDLLPP